MDTKLVYTYVERFGMSQVKKAVKGAEGESLMWKIDKISYNINSKVLDLVWFVEKGA